MSREIVKLLAEQHRNTRHDAVDKIIEVYGRYPKMQNPATDKMLMEISNEIFNLKQRVP